uniref:Shugoshin C-terminal domain-containing protein n=1 Tax=Panagrellus redivivus TaxID=6233 RepID=A0A7E4V5M5_PANRE
MSATDSSDRSDPPKSATDNGDVKTQENKEPEPPKTPERRHHDEPAVLKVTPAILKVKKAMSTFHVNSPSDALMSPCTAALNNRAGAKKPKRFVRPEQHTLKPRSPQKKLDFDQEAE